METPAQEHDPTETVRLVILAVGLALNVWLMWDYLSERPEVMIMRRRIATWWQKTVTEREKRARQLRLMEGETVLEAITIVEGTGDNDKG